jgi:hypothetical protein
MLYLLKLNNLKACGKFIALRRGKCYNLETAIKILRRFEKDRFFMLMRRSAVK